MLISPNNWSQIIQKLRGKEWTPSFCCHQVWNWLEFICNLCLGFESCCWRYTWWKYLGVWMMEEAQNKTQQLIVFGKIHNTIFISRIKCCTIDKRGWYLSHWLLNIYAPYLMFWGNGGGKCHQNIINIYFRL